MLIALESKIQDDVYDPLELAFLQALHSKGRPESDLRHVFDAIKRFSFPR